MSHPSFKKFSYLPLLFSIILLIGIFIGIKLPYIFSSKKGENSFIEFKFTNYDKVNDVINYIERDYVDTVNRNKLEENAIEGLLQNLDPHSVYIPASEFDDANDALLGNFEGIGVMFNVKKDTIVVLNAIAGGPSDKVGIKAGDRIIKIDGKIVAGIKISNNDIIKKLKGKRGTFVGVSVLRRGVSTLLDFTITRDVIPTYSLDAAYMVDPTIGYIRFNKFSATTYEEFVKALDKLRKQGMKKLILDLRGNAGGFLQAAIQMSDEFLENKKLIVYTEGQNRVSQYFYASAKGSFEKEPVVILIDDLSASASEIVAGAIQDNDRGMIIGRRSFGKGLVQEQLKLGDGSAIRLTVARYHTPTGRCIQRPYQKNLEEYYNNLFDRFNRGELENADSIHFIDSLKYTTPKGKIVYGGGGIMPDIFVPLRNDKKMRYLNAIINKGLFEQYAFEYTDKNRKKLNEYKTAEEFNKKFIVTSVLVNDFIQYAQKNGISKDEQGLQYASKIIPIRLKAFIAQNLFETEGFYLIFNPIDSTFITAVRNLSETK